MTIREAVRKTLKRLGEAHYKEIAREIQRPETSVAAAISLDMTSNRESSEFIRVRQGVYALRDERTHLEDPRPAGPDQTVEGDHTPTVPRRLDLLWPTLRALEYSGGSATIGEISLLLAQVLNLPESVLGEPHGDGPQSEVEYEAGWARTYLKKIGAVVNESRRVWAITAEGKGIESEERVRELVRKQLNRERRTKLPGKETEPKRSSVSESDEDWKQELLHVVGEMGPDAFERLCQRILREAGFDKVKVTGRSGDGGIDGVGVLRVNNLLSFHVAFQCKRWAGSVGEGVIRDFRGGVVGSFDKGLVMTTGRFTASASSQAVRDGALAIDLVNGDDLCELIKKHRVGITVETVERVCIDEDFFRKL